MTLEATGPSCTSRGSFIHMPLGCILTDYLENISSLSCVDLKVYTFHYIIIKKNHIWLQKSLGSLAKIPTKPPRLNNHNFAYSHFFQVKMASHEKSEHFSLQLKQLRWLSVARLDKNHPSVCSSGLCTLIIFITQNIKKPCTQRLRLNKNNLYCLFKNIK